MSQNRLIPVLCRALLPALLLLLHLFLNASAADMSELLPPDACGGWKVEGKPLFYDTETLSDRINGEAELYFPYGFDRMAAARYAPQKQPGAGMDVEIYRMGTPLDAFGIYANYRQKEGSTLAVGTESSLSGSQLFLYKGRYFVHIQTTGAQSTDAGVLSGCAGSVASRLPGAAVRPPELAVFDLPEILRDTERYLPQSLLGYDFLNRGIKADAVIGKEELQIFTLLGTTAETAAAAFERYRSNLTSVRAEPGGNGAAIFLEGVDPLYGPVMLLKKGGCFAGTLKFTGRKGVRALLDKVCGR